MLRVAVAEVALSVVVSVTPMVRSLRALVWCTASPMLPMLLVVGVGLCLGGRWPVFGGGRWLVPMALSGRVCSRWCRLLVLALVRVVPAMLRVVAGAGGAGGAGGLGVAGDCVVVGVLWLLRWRGCCGCWCWPGALASSGWGWVACWFPGFGGVVCLWWRRLPLLVA